MYGGIPRNYLIKRTYPTKDNAYGKSLFEQIPLSKFYDACDALKHLPSGTPIIDYLKKQGIIKNEKKD